MTWGLGLEALVEATRVPDAFFSCMKAVAAGLSHVSRTVIGLASTVVNDWVLETGLPVPVENTVSENVLVSVAEAGGATRSPAATNRAAKGRRRRFMQRVPSAWVLRDDMTRLLGRQRAVMSKTW